MQSLHSFIIWVESLLVSPEIYSSEGDADFGVELVPELHDATIMMVSTVVVKKKNFFMYIVVFPFGNVAALSCREACKKVKTLGK